MLDRDARPIGLLVPEGGGWAHRERPLSASVEEPAIAVARRALARPAATRLDPVCACLPDGRFAGLVAVERLLGGHERPVGRVVPATCRHLTHKLKPGAKPSIRRVMTG